MTKKTFAFVGAALMAMSLSLAACGSKAKPAETTPAATETKPAEGGENPCGGAANPCGGGEANPCGGAANPCGGGQQ
jgi:hypothetical protein